MHILPTIGDDYLDLRNAKYSKVREWFQTELIGEATYRTSLSILGLRGEDIDNEVRSAKQEQIKCGM